MDFEACCTCATVLRPPDYDYENEKNPPPSPTHYTPCCKRPICDACLQKNPRYRQYCPYCQLSFGPSALPKEGLRQPPSYTEKQQSSLLVDSTDESPPSYNSIDGPSCSGGTKAAEDVVHHIQQDDTIQTLSLAYKIPASVLRRHNAIWSDNLVAARRTVNIPASHYKGVSLSPKPVDSPEEQERKTRLRRFQTQSKCYDYDVAQLYLKTWSNDVDLALQAWKDDEAWEKNNPVNGTSALKGRPASKITRKSGSR